MKFLKDSLTKIPDESRSVSGFEDAVAQIGGNRILDINLESPARVRLAYCFCFSQSSQITTPARDSSILDLKIFVNRNEPRGVSIAEEYLYSGESLYDSSSFNPFYYYKFHDREFGKGAVSVYDEPGQVSTTHFEGLDNIPTNFLGLTAIPRLLEDSQYPPENTSVYKIRRALIELVSKWQFYNANNMDWNLIRMSEPKIGGSDIYLSSTGDNLPLVLDNLKLLVSTTIKEIVAKKNSHKR